MHEIETLLGELVELVVLVVGVELEAAVVVGVVITVDVGVVAGVVVVVADVVPLRAK